MRVIELNFLSELFTLCGDNTSREYNICEVGSKCGCSWNETKQITEKLSELDLIKNERMPDKVAITYKGISLIKGSFGFRKTDRIFRDFYYHIYRTFDLSIRGSLLMFFPFFTLNWESRK
jgi:predicted transcriptional regulator